VKELKGFQRLSLKAGEERLVSFRIDRSHIRFLDINLRPVVEPGEVEVMIGSSSDDIRLSGLLMIGR
jgi:beta-glucosidase